MSVPVQIIINAKDNASGPIRGVSSSLTSLGAQADSGASRLKALAGPLTGIGVAALAGFGAAAIGVAGAGIQMNASMEQSRIAFAGLLKDGQKADAFLKELADFAARTPFEFPELQGAARKLLAFGFSAEQIIPMLTDVGDAVAGIGGGQDEIDRVTMALGQMKAKGKVSAEEMMQIAELGIPAWDMLAKSMGLSVAEVMKLSEKGLIPADKAIHAVLGGMNKMFGGQMANQAGTFNGLLSTLKDNLNAALRAFTGPLFEHAKSALKQLGDAVSSPAFQQFAATMGQKVGDAITKAISFLSRLRATFGDLASAAVSWGANIVNSLAAGIARAASAVVAALAQIGAVITSWLKPGSPPKLLPELDAWGAGAATAYMDGWKDADFSGLDALASTVRETLESLADVGEMNQVDIIPTLFGSQAAIAKAIDELNKLGDVTEETFEQMVAAAGPAGPKVQGLMRAYIDLRKATDATNRAQQELNDTTAKYLGIISPLQKDLQAIQDRKQEIDDAQRIAELNEIIHDDEADALEKEKAALEIQEIEKERQITLLERERDTAVDAAQQKLDAAETEQAAAEERLAAQQAMIEASNKQNELLLEQRDLLAELAKSSAGGGGGGGAAVPDIGATLTESLAPVQEVNAVISDSRQRYMDFKDSLADTANTATSIFAPAMARLQSAWATLQPVIAPVISFLQTNAEPILAGIASVLGQQLVVAAAAAVASFAAMAAPIVGAIAISAALYAAWQTNFAGIQDVTGNVLGAVQNVIGAVLGQVALFWQSHGDEVMAFVRQTWDQITAIIQVALQLIQQIVVPLLNRLAQFINSHSTEIQQILTHAWNIIRTIISTVLGTIQGLIEAALLVVQGDWQGAWNKVKETSANFVLGIIRIITEWVGILKTMFGDLVANLAETITKWASDGKASFDTFVEDVKKTVATWVDDIKKYFTTFVADAKEIIKGLADDAVGLGRNIVDGIIDGVKSAAGRLMSTLKDLASNALKAAKDVLGISSPSKVFEEQIGAQIAQGMARGIARGAPQVAASSRYLGMTSAAAAAPVSSSITNNYTLNYAGHSATDGDVRDALRLQSLLMGSF